MQKFFVLLCCTLMIISCQNSNSNTEAGATATETAPPPPAPKLDMDGFQAEEVKNKVISSLKEMNELKEQIDALPAKVKKAHADEITSMQELLDNLSGKQTILIDEIKVAIRQIDEIGQVKPGNEAEIPADAILGANAAMRDGQDALDRYGKEVQAVREQYQKMLEEAKGKQH